MRRAVQWGIVFATGVAALTLAACSAQAASPVGTWGEGGEGKPQLVLEEGGALSGTDGCNRLTGGWEQQGDTISFGEVASTAMACQGVDTWLVGLSTATVDGKTLHVSDASGAEIGTLTRVSK